MLVFVSVTVDLSPLAVSGNAAAVREERPLGCRERPAVEG